MLIHKNNCEPLIYCDCPSHEEMIEEYFVELQNIKHGGYHAPWLTRQEVITQIEGEINKLQKELSNG